MLDLQPLYPFLFENNFRTVVWGGNSLKPMKGLQADAECIGESWEVSAVPEMESVVKNGPLAGCSLAQITEQYKKYLLGEAVYEKYGTVFPVLVKYIDAVQDLSIQVHPNDELAAERHGCFGKTEMWYVISATTGAYLYSGFNQPISQYEYEKRVEDGSICDVLEKHEVKAGDCFYIPSGRVHAICGGILIAEIQQSSNITYRIFDYNRPGLDGKMRQLHIQEAKEAIDFKVYDDYRVRYENCINKPVPLVVNQYFVVKILEVDRAFHRKLYKYDSFIIYMCVEGDCTIRIRSAERNENGAMPAEEDRIVRLTQGNSCLVPAACADFDVSPNNEAGITKLLEVYIDNKNFE